MTEVTTTFGEQTPSSLITTKEAAAIIGITTNNLRQYAFRGVVKPVSRQGRAALYDEAQVRAFAAQRKPKP